MRIYRFAAPGWLPLLTLAGLLSSACQRGFANRPQADHRDSVVTTVGNILRTGRGIPGRAPNAEERAELERLYAASGNTALWLTGKGKLRGAGKDALERLKNASLDGLRPEDYGTVRLDSLARSLEAQKGDDHTLLASVDAGLSLALLRYLRDVHVGRVNPRSIGFSMNPPEEHHDYASLLGNVVRESNLAETIAELAPPLAQYRQVQAALQRYRELAKDSLAAGRLSLPVPLKPGASAPGLDALARRLVLSGDLAAMPAGAELTRYDGALLEAVRRFEARHGLDPDSTLGRETLEELNVPLIWRARQLELAMERLRWLRDLPNAPFLLVNIPMFEVTAWSSPLASGPPAFRTGVIVGKALDTQTPVFVEEMRYVVFQPFWNIPPSIAREETIPAIEKNRDYFRRQNLEIVDGQGDDADPVEPSDDALRQVASGKLRIRQRPGAGNALGPIKFVFPNNANVYLHGTPAEELFDRTRRDFSHGCVRVEDPTGLAEWVLSDQPEWTRERIVAAMEEPGKISRRVSLTRPLTVVLFYNTATVEPDGTVRFARDIYGHDQRLDAALEAAR